MLTEPPRSHPRLATGKSTLRKYRTQMRQAFRRDPNTRYRILWYVGVLGIAGVFLGVGGGYAVGGVKSTYSVAPFRILLESFPHNLRAHGIILVLLSAFTILGCGAMMKDFTKATWHLARVPIIASLVYAFWTFWMFAGAWWENHTYTSIMWWYLLAAVLSGASASLTPPFDAERRKNVGT